MSRRLKFGICSIAAGLVQAVSFVAWRQWHNLPDEIVTPIHVFYYTVLGGVLSQGFYIIYELLWPPTPAADTK